MSEFGLIHRRAGFLVAAESGRRCRPGLSFVVLAVFVWQRIEPLAELPGAEEVMIWVSGHVAYFWPRDAPVLALPEMHRDSTTSASAPSLRGGRWLHAISVAARCSRTIRVALSDPRCATCDAEGAGRPPRFITIQSPAAALHWRATTCAPPWKGRSPNSLPMVVASTL
jgi:hypothetical protein